MEIVIAKGTRIVAIPQSKFTVGLLKGKVTGQGPDFFKPMSEDELALWEGAV
ncbi:hypothetical protein N182_26385 [Sinorhizobium sp. GL2]|nr:hypothetical protein N182_26385 [Sinorhizobium sp. GL2]